MNIIYIEFPGTSKSFILKKIIFMLILIVIGLVIVALPDSDERLFSISKDHGPSMQDAIGLVMLLIGYGWFLIQTWKRRGRLLQYKKRLSFKLILPVIVIGIGIALIIVSVVNDFGYWWVGGAMMLAIVQSIVFYIALSE
jgi:drug/metabolite transporter (DMT)-like permease